MDLDTIITFVIFLLFFILPSLLKVLGKKKKTGRPGFIGKIGDQIQKFVQELEEQGKKQDPKASENVWEMFESEPQQQFPEPVRPPFVEQPPKIPVDRLYAQEVSIEKPPVEMPAARRTFIPEKKAPVSKPSILAGIKLPGTAGYGIQTPIKRHPLQNAVIWSEILASPLALRNKP